MFSNSLLRNLAVLLLALSLCLLGAVTGSITGTVKDPSGAPIQGVVVTMRNTAQGIETRATSDSRGSFTFPSLTVGKYDLQFEAPGFRTEKKLGLAIETDAALKVDATLLVAEQNESITVQDSVSQIHVETVSTQLGEVVSGSQMTAVALNGRSFTDLLALQPGIVPMTTQQPDSIVMTGASVAIAPSGTLNPGNQSISGQREDANGYRVNGGDVKELMNGGTSVVPNLDSIAEFRILTNNFDAEYGNYSGGVVNVVTKSGSNELHGSAFDFVRNTALDSRNFFSPERSFYRQNQFGGTIGGPIRRNKVFFFGDYQGTRTGQGVDTGLIPVPSLANRAGNFQDSAGDFTGTVSGPYLANQLTNKLGYGVTSDEPYYFNGCTSSAQCVFPNAIIPQRAWSEPSKNLLQYIPLPSNGDSTFSTAAQGKKLKDHKGGIRVDGSSERWGLLSAYYFIDDYNLINPYPTGQGGASVPGFAGTNLGRSQLINLGQTKTIGATAVNELRLSYMRNYNNVGDPSGGVGPSLASQGFVTGPGTPGIVVLDPKIEGIENVVFKSFVMGTPITNLRQANNTYSLIDNFSKVIGGHTIKTGFQFSYEQVNVNPNPTFNGSFSFYGSETGNDIADFLIGTPSNYNQADAMAYYGRHRYAAGYLQDSWRARSTLTINFGVRWDLMRYWSEKYNQIPTLILNKQSEIYPGAPTGLVFPGDRGVPSTLVPQSNRFSPRFGIAYSPNKSDGWLGKLIGGTGKLSIRAGYGMFYSVIQGNTIAIDEPQPPFGLSYTSPAPPLFATPFITAATGEFQGQPFPLTFPKLNGASIAKPDNSPDFSQYIPFAGLTTPYYQNKYPYNQNYFLSIQRQLGQDTLLSLSYVGSQAHHLLLVYSANPGDPALCLSLSRPSQVAPGTATCGPFSEDATYTRADGKVFKGTRGPFGSNLSNDDYQGAFGNSSYNSFQASLHHNSRFLSLNVGYTYSKSIDQASSISDPVNPFNFKATRALSAWDLRHNLVASYQIPLPFDMLSRGRYRMLTKGWAISGITRISSGFPVTISSDSDNSLLGSVPNGVNNKSLDLPDYTPGKLNLNGNPRNGLEYFNTSLFASNALGTPGNASRRSFYGPGALNFDLALLRNFRISERKALQFRLESFNTFNHAQFFGPAAVNGDIDSGLFGSVVKAAPPRLMQVALKFSF